MFLGGRGLGFENFQWLLHVHMLNKNWFFFFSMKNETPLFGLSGFGVGGVVS
jgi:hypothetical protein